MGLYRQPAKGETKTGGVNPTVFFFGLFLAVTVAQLPFGGPTLINIIVSIIVASWMGASLKISTTVLEAFSGESRFELIEERTVPIFDLTTKLLIILILVTGI